jgi:hypothetical protein
MIGAASSGHLEADLKSRDPGAMELRIGAVARRAGVRTSLVRCYEIDALAP